MKKMLGLLAGLMAMTMVTSDTTSTAQAQYNWTCRAVSPVATGIGVSYSRRVAGNIALNECGMRTPYYMVCVVDDCW